MMVLNPIRINDWEMKRFLRLIVVIQIAVVATVVFDSISELSLPMRPILLFVYLGFIPGAIALRVLRLHELGTGMTLLYSVGLSIAILMLVGLTVNTVGPPLGANRPLSTWVLLIAISSVVLSLSFIAYLRDSGFSGNASFELSNIPWRAAVFLVILPLLSVAGSYVMNNYNSNTVSIVGLVCVSLLAVPIAFGGKSINRLHTSIIASASLALLLLSSLVSNHLWGWDIQSEYFIAHTVMLDGKWSLTTYGTTQGMLSITILAPFLSILCNTSLTWIFKIMYPIFFSLVPLGLYYVYSRFTTARTAALSAFFFMSVSMFSFEMVQLARQEIAELFFVLLIPLMIDKNRRLTQTSTLVILFSFSLIVSHYGLSYYMLACLAIVFLTSKYGKGRDWRIHSPGVTFRLMALFLTLTVAWYVFVSGSASFQKIISIGQDIGADLFSNLLDPNTVQGLAVVVSGTASPLHEVTKYMYLLSQLFIVIGLAGFIAKRNKSLIEERFKPLALAALVFLIAALTIPYVASSLNTSRIYHIALLSLAPFFVIGAIASVRFLRSRTRNLPFIGTSPRELTTWPIGIYLTLFLLFNSGVIYEVAGDIPTSFALDSSIDGPVFHNQEVAAASWIAAKSNGQTIYADAYRWLLIGSYDWYSANRLTMDTGVPTADSYLFLGTWNAIKGEFLVENSTTATNRLEYVSSASIAGHGDRILCIGGAEVFFYPRD